MKAIYLDHAATTEVSKEVLDAMIPYFGPEYGNASSLYQIGRNSHVVIENARKSIASILGAESEEIIFTSGGTESDNMAILGIARANRAHGNHVLISSIEHKAVIEPAKQLEREGFVIEYIPVNEEGLVDVRDVTSRITEKTILISVMYANNEIGTIQPIKELAEAIRETNGQRLTPSAYPILHTDACQAAGYVPLSDLGVDAMTINGSKIYGPKGIGILYKNKNVKIEPTIFGGGQESGLRSGTENLPSIIGLAKALESVEDKKEKEVARLTSLRDYFISALRAAIPQMVLNGHPTQRLPNNVHISIPHIEGESILLMLDEKGIQASTGSACSASDLQVSHVLVAINQDPNLMHGSVRFSLGESTTKEDCDYVVNVMSEIVARLKSISPLTK